MPDTPTSAVSSLPGNLAAFLLPTLVLNGIIFGLGWDVSTPPSPYLPPGWVVGSIWVVLFIAMAIARWLLVRAHTIAAARDARLVVLLGTLCLIYPLYTVGLSSQSIGLAGAIVTALIAVWVAVRIARSSPAASALTGLLIAWLVYASIGLARTMHAQGTL